MGMSTPSEPLRFPPTRGSLLSSTARVSRCRTILLAEDTVDDEYLILRALSRIGMPILTKIARNGMQALDILQMEYLPEERICSRPDLILCDMKMPRVGGDEVLRHVRADAAYRTVPFVMYSSSDEECDQTRCRDMGCDAYVTKPVDYRQFIHSVQCIVEHFLAGSDAPQPKGALIWS